MKLATRSSDSISKKRGLSYFKMACLGLMGIWLLLRFWPLALDDQPHSAVLEDRQGNLLGASIASDGQWRFPPSSELPEKLQTAILVFEDRYFFYHPGVNPVSLIRASIQNTRSGKVVSGASTLTMQLARMHYREQRTVGQKIKEILAALALEARYPKQEILLKYVSQAPYGGNIVGVDAATWRYFGRSVDELSWAETALLAILPNQPSALYPGKSSDSLKQKRDRLLKNLLDRGHIDQLEFDLAVDEPLPEKPYPIPTENTHLLQSLRAKSGNKRFTSSLDSYWQRQARTVAERFQREFKGNGVDNIAALVVDLADSKVLAYVGNTTDTEADGQQVDIVHRKRSSGSILKPLLFAGAIDKGLISPRTLLPDIPTFFSGFTPKNFNHHFEGAVPAHEALAKSLNIPFVHLLKDYQYEQFQVELIQSGFSSLEKNADRYGLSLVLGGAEVTLWDLANVYTAWYQKLAGSPFHGVEVHAEPERAAKAIFEPMAIWHTFQAMTELIRPGLDQNWETFDSSQKVAWKTGTSIGFRDAWAVGLNGTVLVAVWVGNADGEGRAALTGTGTAGRVLLELLNLSSHDPYWLERLKPIASPRLICPHSGYLVGKDCGEPVELDLPETVDRLGICPYHHTFYVDPQSGQRVNSSCFPLHRAVSQTGFAIPPSWAYYYKRKNPSYKGLPPVMEACQERSNPIAMIYPTAASKIYLPKGAQGKEKVVLQASYADVDTGILYWHLDDQYLGETKKQHENTLWLARGIYQLTLTDALGNRLSQRLEVVSD